MKSKLNIYTISVLEDTDGDPNDCLILGSYVSYDTAVNALTDVVISKLYRRKDYALAFADDINHPEMRGAIDWNNGHFIIGKKTIDEIRRYVCEAIHDHRMYVIFSERMGDSLFVFSMDENDVELHGSHEIDEAVAQIIKNEKED